MSPPETITAAEAVEMVMERFERSGCTEAEAGAWATEHVRKEKLKLLWAEQSPEYPYGRPNGLFLAGDNSFDGANGSPIYLPGFPGARALDELDWGTGVLRRRVRWPKIVDREGKDIDAAALSDYDRQRASSDILWSEYELDPPADETSPLAVTERTEREVRAALREYFVKEWVIEELTYPFSVKRASLVAILDRASMPLGTIPVRLSEAAAMLANRFNVSARIGRDAIVEAAAAGRIEVYGKRPSKLPGQGDRIGLRVWRQVSRAEATLSDDGSALFTRALNGKPAEWSDLFVFRADLERLMRELASDGNPAKGETGLAEPPPAAAECPSAPRGDDSGTGHDGEPEGPPETAAPRLTPKEWLARFVADGKHENRDTTLKTMRDAYSLLGVRGSLAVWNDFTKENSQLKLSRRGRKLKRNTNN